MVRSVVGYQRPCFCGFHTSSGTRTEPSSLRSAEEELGVVRTLVRDLGRDPAQIPHEIPHLFPE